MSDMDEFDVPPGPLSMFRKIPKAVRWWIYSIAMTVFGIEVVLDIFGVGIIPARGQEIALGILGLFGFTMATANTTITKET